jgi:hypothetical protein
MMVPVNSRAYFCWSDISTWAPLLDASRDGVSPDDVRALLRRVYAGFRAFHGCKPIDVDAYRKEGLLAHDRDVLHAEVKARIVAAHPEIDPAQIDRAIRAATPGGGRPEVCAFVDRRYLVGQGKEFCVRGSEMPLRVARYVAGYSGVDVRSTFTEPGTPLVVEFGVNWMDGPYHVKKELPDYVHEALEPARAGEAPRVFDMPHVQLKSVPPSMIFAIDQPSL